MKIIKIYYNKYKLFCIDFAEYNINHKDKIFDAD